MITATIEINKLRLRALHGVLVQERIAGNIFEVTVHLHYPVMSAIESDDIDSTLNYAEVVETIKTVMEQPSQLLEHVAGRLHKALTQQFPAISGGMIRIAKVTPPISTQLNSVAVTLNW
ncbi:MAG: dihydroneopterin aldolase [Muribaculaceae bacterium]|nr:dihydroneopterin aldolase [Muribaculaceae bacterium]